MMVLFTSLSDKKALKTTRWILDAFAERIGQDVWQTVITAEGLQMFAHRDGTDGFFICRMKKMDKTNKKG